MNSRESGFTLKAAFSPHSAWLTDPTGMWSGGFFIRFPRKMTKDITYAHSSVKGVKGLCILPHRYGWGGAHPSFTTNMQNKLDGVDSSFARNVSILQAGCHRYGADQWCQGKRGQVIGQGRHEGRVTWVRWEKGAAQRGQD